MPPRASDSLVLREERSLGSRGFLELVGVRIRSGAPGALGPAEAWERLVLHPMGRGSLGVVTFRATDRPALIRGVDALLAAGDDTVQDQKRTWTFEGPGGLRLELVMGRERSGPAVRSVRIAAPETRGDGEAHLDGDLDLLRQLKELLGPEGR